MVTKNMELALSGPPTSDPPHFDVPVYSSCTAPEIDKLLANFELLNQ